VEQILERTKVVGVKYDNDDGINRQLIISEACAEKLVTLLVIVFNK